MIGNRANHYHQNLQDIFCSHVFRGQLCVECLRTQHRQHDRNKTELGTDKFLQQHTGGHSARRSQYCSSVAPANM